MRSRWILLCFGLCAVSCVAADSPAAPPTAARSADIGTPRRVERTAGASSALREPRTTTPPRLPEDCLVPLARLTPPPAATPPATPPPGRTETPAGSPTPALGPRILPPVAVTPAAPYRPIATREDAAFTRRLRDAAGDDADELAFVVTEVSSGLSATHNATKVFYAASLFKLFVMYEAFHQESAGLLRLADEVTITPRYDAYGLGPRATRLCDTLTVAGALEAMMSVSDNAAAVLLQDLVGAANVNRSLQTAGLKDSRLLTEGLPVTAGDLALLLQAIARGRAIDREASQQMVDLLAGETFDNGLRAAVPPEVPVAHKTGNWRDATHDAGIVFAPSGTYVIVVLVEEENARAAVRAVAAAAYGYLSTRRR